MKRYLANHKIMKNTFWAGLELFGQQGIQVIIAIVLARILEPRDFGLIAMTTIFIMGANTIIEGGFTAALIHLKEITREDKSISFIFNISTALIFFVVFWYGSPIIANFYDEPHLVSIIRVLSFGLIINSFGIVNNSILTRQLLFKKKALISTLSVFISGINGILLALLGYGIWALVIQQITMYTIRTILLWVINYWKPLLKLNTNSFKNLFTYGSKLMFSMMFRAVFENIYSLVIGKVYTATELGYYYRSNRFALIASQAPTTVISRVSFPSLSRLQDNNAALIEEFGKYYQMLNFIVFPLLILMAVTAQNFIFVLVGEKWLPSTPYLIILCISGLFFPLHILIYTLLNSLGYSNVSFKLEISRGVFITLALLLTYNDGMKALLIWQTISLFLYTLFAIIYSKNYTDIGSGTYLRWLSPIIISSALMTIILLLINNKFSNTGVISLMAKFMIGLFIYTLTLYFLRFPLMVSLLKKIKAN